MQGSFDWQQLIGGGLLGMIGTLMVGLVNRKPALDAAVNARVEILITAYEKRIESLVAELAEVKKEVHQLNDKLAKYSGTFGL